MSGVSGAPSVVAVEERSGGAGGKGFGFFLQPAMLVRSAAANISVDRRRRPAKIARESFGASCKGRAITSP